MSTICVTLVIYIRHIRIHICKYRDLYTDCNIFYVAAIRIKIYRSNFQLCNQRGILFAHYTFNVNVKYCYILLNTAEDEVDYANTLHAEIRRRNIVYSNICFWCIALVFFCNTVFRRSSGIINELGVGGLVLRVNFFL
jgi:hypothetical protein